MSNDLDKTDPWVCFHFEPVEWNEDESWNEEATYNKRARPLFDALPFALDVDYVGGTSGIEAWEAITPSVEWLNVRIPALFNIAAQSSLSFSGWSFEPREPCNFTFVSCGPNLRVFNANSPEGKAAIEELVEEQADVMETKTSNA